MMVVFDERYREVYSDDPASAPGRIESILESIRDLYQFVEPANAGDDDVRLVHSEAHLEYVKRQGLIYDIAMLAVGGTLKAAELAMTSEPAFGLVRPPGHHASNDSSWGFCYFNNVAIAIEKLRKAGLIQTAFILDIDLHFGDGTSNIFGGVPQVVYYHAARSDTIEAIKDHLSTAGDRDIIAVSAGFDRHEQDWGGMLKTEDYNEIGRIIRDYAKKNAQGRCFAVLEGGYNHSVLGANVKAFLDGME